MSLLVGPHGVESGHGRARHSDGLARSVNDSMKHVRGNGSLLGDLKKGKYQKITMCKIMVFYGAKGLFGVFGDDVNYLD